MPVQHPNLVRFNGGQWSEKLWAREDLEDYEASMKSMTGFIPLKYGEAQAMTGFVFAEETKFPDRKSVFIPFQYSATDSFWLELGHLHMRFVNPSDGSYVRDGATIVEIATPYLEENLYKVQYQNLNDLVVLTDGINMPKEVTRNSDTSWTITDYVQEYPAFLTENTDEAKKITPSGTLTVGGTATLTATGHAPFTADHVGAYWAVTHERDSVEESVLFQDAHASLPSALYSSSVKVKGDWNWFTSMQDLPDAFGEIGLERSTDGGTNWAAIRKRTIRGGVPNVDLSGTEEEDDVLYRFYILNESLNAGDGTNVVTLTVNQVDITGYILIDTFTSSTVVSGEVIAAIEKAESTDQWQEGGWSDYQGYPKASTSFEQRMFFGGTTRKPTAVWASATDDISNLDFRDTAADQAFFRVIDNSQNAIQWMARKDKVIIGTAGEEFYLSSSNEQEAITPENVTVKTSGGSGSAAIKPVSLGSSLAFVTLNGIQLREIGFDPDSGIENSDTDLTELADEITGTGIKQIAYQQYPNRTIYLVRDDGLLLGLVYDKKNQVNGWFTRETDGEVESVVSTRSGTGVNDPVGIIVKRVINGVTKRYIEVLAAPSDTNTEWNYLDSSVVLGASSASITGADHLEGKTVSVMRDGAYIGTRTVSSGSFSLDKAASSSVVYGLPYAAEFTTLPLKLNTGDGSSRGKPKSISHVLLGVRKSLAGEYGYEARDDKGDLVHKSDSVYPIDTRDRVMGTSQEPVTRYYNLPIEGGNWREISLRIQRDKPVPLNVTHAIPAASVGGD